MAFVAYEVDKRKNFNQLAPFVSITASRILYINSTAVTLYDLKKYNYAEFLYDKDISVVGIIFTKEKHKEGLLKLYFREKLNEFNLTIAFKGFMDFFSIPTQNKAVRYSLEYDFKSKMFVFDLKNPYRRRNHGF